MIRGHRATQRAQAPAGGDGTLPGAGRRRARAPALSVGARWLLAALAVGWLAACETIDDRIERHRGFFDTLDPQTQALLRAGEVRVGFTETMARIAFGAPDAVLRRTTDEGESTVWLYRYYYPVYDGTYFVGYRVYDVTRHGVRRVLRVPEYRDYYRYEPEVYLQLVFRGGRIVEIVRAE